MPSSHFFITGQLSFSPRKITLESSDTSYFVRTRSLHDAYVHGDIVCARVVKSHDGSHLAEVDIHTLVRRTEDTLLGRFVTRKDAVFFEILPEQ